MSIVVLACAGLLSLANADSSAPDVTAEYQKVKASMGRTADDQVRLALWCETNGLTAERVRHLALAVLANPTHATARGLLGLVAQDGRWVAPDAIAATVRTDAPRQTLLDEYDERRSRTESTVAGQWALGVWADQQGLTDQARAHFTAVVRLDSTHEKAWKRLGFKKVAGRWTTHDRIVAEQAEIEAQERADRTWKPRLERWKQQLDDSGTAEKARIKLSGVTDPRAIRSIEAVFGDRTATHELVAVGLLGQIDGAPASLALASLAIRGHSPEVRRVAVETLVPRDARDFIAVLTRLVQTPWRYEVRALTGPTSPGELFVEGERFNVRKIYNPPPLGALSGSLLAQANLTRTTLANQPAPEATRRLTRLATEATRQISTPASRDRETVTGDGQLARRRLVEDVRELETANATIRANNDRILPVLTRITRQNFGENREAWERWQTDQAGYASLSSSADKPTIIEIDQLTEQSYLPPPPRGECFARGTLVRTIDGARPIEQLQRGDLVLTQNTTSGALSYQPILTTFDMPPAPSVRIAVGTESIVATGIHRFWQAGKGWRMARDLKPGDRLRTLGGVASVAAVGVEPEQPMYNLEVGAARTYFVGRVAALVHDNTLIETTPNPFDAPREVVPLEAMSIAR